jgi:hypothetical protein
VARWAPHAALQRHRLGSPLKSNVEAAAMEYDQRKIEEVVIALLGARVRERSSLEAL